MKTVEITKEPISTEKLTALFIDPSCGAYVTFEGRVRDYHEGRKVGGLTYEAFIPMARKVLGEIASEAKERFGVEHIHLVHRIGDLQIGDIAVWIGVISPHRKEAFTACQYVIDELKKRAPIWKNEIYETGERKWI